MSINTSDKLHICYNSYDEPAGCNYGESIKNGVEYFKLSKINDWRKILSDDWNCTIKYNDKLYDSVSEAFMYESVMFNINKFLDTGKLKRDLLYIKFTSSDTLKQVLLATNNAQLFSHSCGTYENHMDIIDKEQYHINDLEYVRERIRVKVEPHDIKA